MFHATPSASWTSCRPKCTQWLFIRSKGGRAGSWPPVPAGVGVKLHTFPSARQRITPCSQPIAPPFHFPGCAQTRRLTFLDVYEPRRVTELAARDIDGLLCCSLPGGTPPNTPSSPSARPPDVYKRVCPPTRPSSFLYTASLIGMCPSKKFCDRSLTQS